jgi:hypothetical protein
LLSAALPFILSLASLLVFTVRRVTARETLKIEETSGGTKDSTGTAIGCTVRLGARAELHIQKRWTPTRKMPETWIKIEGASKIVDGPCLQLFPRTVRLAFYFNFEGHDDLDTKLTKNAVNLSTNPS